MIQDPLLPVPIATLSAAALAGALAAVGWYAEPWRFEAGWGRLAPAAWGAGLTVLVAIGLYALQVIVRADRPTLPSQVITQDWSWWPGLLLAIPLLAFGAFGPGLGLSLYEDPGFGSGKALFIGVASVVMLGLGLVLNTTPQIVWVDGAFLRVRSPWQPAATAAPTAEVKAVMLTSSTWNWRRWYGARLVLRDGSELGLVGGLNPDWVDATARRIAERVGAPIENRR